MTYGKTLTRELSIIIIITATLSSSKLPSEIDFHLSPKTNGISWYLIVATSWFLAYGQKADFFSSHEQCNDFQNSCESRVTWDDFLSEIQNCSEFKTKIKIVDIWCHINAKRKQGLENSGNNRLL